MTSYKIIYNAFLGKIEEDKWCNESSDYTAAVADWENFLEAAIPWFKFPRVSLERVPTTYEDGEVVLGYFTEDLGDQEIQIIATLMKWMWLDRTINSWENVKVMYDERDFSQANLLDKFIKLQETVQAKNRKLQKMYSRSITDPSDGIRRPFDYSKLAGGGE